MSEMSDYDKANIREILAGDGDWYTAHLIRLIVKADGNNLRKLARVYPDEVQAVLEFLGDRHGEVFASLVPDDCCCHDTAGCVEIAREQRP